MSIEEQLQRDLVSAMRAKEADTVATIRQLRAKAQEAQNAMGFTGPTDDAFFRSVIAAYVKQLTKGAAELRQAGGRGEVLAQKYEGEVTYLSRYLPAMLSREQALPLVQQALKEAGLTEAKDAGRAMGVVLKAHKGQMAPELVRTLIGEVLTAKPGAGS